MSGQTIRDVVIRVSIENSGMKLGPIDTSALESQLAGITGSVSNAIGRGVQGRTTGGWQGMNSFQAQSVLQQNGLQSDLSDYLASQGATFPTQKDRERNIAAAVQAQNERDKSHRDYLKRQAEEKKAVNSLTPEERGQVSSFGKIMREREKAKEKENKDANNAIAEVLKKQAEAAQSAQQANNAYTASVRAGALAAVEFAKGLAFIATSGKESETVLASNLVAIQGYYNLVRGGMNAMTSIGDAMKARSIANSEGSDQSGLGGAATAGVPAAGRLLANPYTALAAMAAGVGLFHRAKNQWEVENSHRQSGLNIDYASIASETSDNAVGRHVSQSIRLSNAIPNFGEMRQGLINQSRRQQTEQDIRNEQNSSTRDYGARMEMRERAERRQSILERADAARNISRHVDEQIGALSGTRAQFAKDKARSAQDYQAKIANINRSMRKPTGVSRAWGLVTGEESDHDVAVFNLQKKQELKEAESDRQQEINRQKEAEVQLDERSLQLGVKKAQTVEETLNALKAQADASRQNYERDKQTVDSAKERIGAMDEGSIFKIKGVQNKMKNGNTLQQWEIEAGLSAGVGTKVYDYALAQARKRAESKGIEYSPDLVTSKGKADADEATLKDQQPQLVQELNKLSKTNDDLGKELVSAIRQSFDVKEIVEYVKKSVAETRLWTKEQLRLKKNIL